MRNFKVEAIVIKRINFGEADRIITVLTEKGEKIKIKAAGVRKITSKRSSHVELLNQSLFSLYKSRGFPILTEAQTLESFSLIKNNLLKIGFAYHVCELIDALCPENQENKIIFFLLKKTLKDLTVKANDLEIIHNFETDLLINLGFYPQDQVSENFDSVSFIEKILERKLKTKQILPQL